MKIHIEILNDKDERLFTHYNDHADLYSLRSVILMMSYKFMQLQEKKHETKTRQIETNETN